MTHTSHPGASAAQWLEGARPHTWANAISPVLAGTAAAQLAGGANFFHAFLALVVSLALIIGVNYANDYSDGIRGTDEDRSGPLRLTGSGLVEPSKVKYAAFASFAVAGIAGIVLSLLSAWWFILIGLGAQPPTAEWGVMVASGRNFILDQWWYSTFPGLAILLTVLSFNFLGDGLRDAMDPRIRGR